MSPSTPVPERRPQQAEEEILQAAWRVAEREGVAGLSLRELAGEAEARSAPPYTYFESKAAIYDAMFAQGCRELEAAEAKLEVDPDDPVGTLERSFELFVDFCCASMARFQLMFTRAVPGWEPSPEASAVSVATYERSVEELAPLGIDDPRHLDLMTALLCGLASQQLANEPGGDRWRRLSREAAEMYVAHLRRARKQA